MWLIILERGGNQGGNSLLVFEKNNEQFLILLKLRGSAIQSLVAPTAPGIEI